MGSNNIQMFGVIYKIANTVSSMLSIRKYVRENFNKEIFLKYHLFSPHHVSISESCFTHPFISSDMRDKFFLNFF